MPLTTDEESSLLLLSLSSSSTTAVTTAERILSSSSSSPSASVEHSATATMDKATLNSRDDSARTESTNARLVRNQDEGATEVATAETTANNDEQTHDEVRSSSKRRAERRSVNSGETVDLTNNIATVQVPGNTGNASTSRSARRTRSSADDIGLRSQSRRNSAAARNRRSSEPTPNNSNNNAAGSNTGSSANNALQRQTGNLASSIRPLPPTFDSALSSSTPLRPSVAAATDPGATPSTPQNSSQQQQQQQQQSQPFRLRMITSEELLAQLSTSTASPPTPAWIESSQQQQQDFPEFNRIPISANTNNRSGLLHFGGTNTDLPRPLLLQRPDLDSVPELLPRSRGAVPRLPPLQPQPIVLQSPPQQQQRRTVNVGTDDDNDYGLNNSVSPEAAAAATANASYSRFRCPICFEYMSDPASCGFCSTRYCWECLCRVAVRLDHAHRSAFGSAKCPTCREIFSIGTIRRDKELKEEIQRQVVSCPFAGCGKVMQLHELAGHESTCSHCTLKCRFATMGCPWTGRRSDLSPHETSECAFYPLRQWIEQTRQTSHDHAQKLIRAQEEITSLAAMIEAMETSEFLVRPQVKCPNNPLHLLEYTVVSLCTTPLLIFYSRDVWRYFHHSEQARGTVFNFLTMFPTQILLMTVTASGYRLFLEQMTVNSAADWNKEQLDRVVDVFLSFSLTLLWILLLSAMYVDGQSSLDWRVFQAPGFLMDNMMNHVVSLGMLAAHFAVWQFLDSTRVGLLIWGWILLSSTFVPSVVSSISVVMNRIETTWPERPVMLEVPNPSTFLLTGRAGNAVMFGLRYGVLAASIGILPTVDAMMILIALRDFIPQLVSYHWAYPEVNEPLLSWIPQCSPLAHTVVVVRVAMEAWLWIHHSSDSTLQESLLATGCLLLVNQTTLRLIQLGALLGSAVATTWTSFDQNGGAPERDYSAFGMTVFGMWCFSLATIAMSTGHK